METNKEIKKWDGGGGARKEEKEEGWGREKQIMLRQRYEEGISILNTKEKMDNWESEMEGGGKETRPGGTCMCILFLPVEWGKFNKYTHLCILYWKIGTCFICWLGSHQHHIHSLWKFILIILYTQKKINNENIHVIKERIIHFF